MAFFLYNNAYTVAKLKDGNCWMTQNLRLGGDKPITLTSEDTDVSSDFILPESSPNNFANKSGAKLVIYDYPGHGKVAYYNWYTAAAGGNSSYSICPKGWRLPTPDEAKTFVSKYNYETAKASPVNYFGHGYITTNDGKPDVGSCDTCPSHYYDGYGCLWTSSSGFYIMFWANTLYYQDGWVNTDSGFPMRCVSRK